ncbi:MULTISPECIES: hypothetical protein [unclassified Pedobacter]|uniref:hypothetical protein n=1 Tax=unclassified Pedobacter TaxID=2628915 RepID=UPI00141D7AEA|nr:MULTISPECIES: hypothetical protein [unclassified Pedobacter]NII81726.1 hypothetical protein [Pedobacter sp. SG908]NMN35730.1 hypothetical protein [Pedobacter sp. SG918]
MKKYLKPSLIELNGTKVEFTTNRGMIAIPVRALTVQAPTVSDHVGNRPFGSLSPFDTDYIEYHDADLLAWLLDCPEEEFQAAMIGFWKTRKEAFVC